MKNNETGRSMVEMLGVLAIIGVLSAGGLAGYSKAMFKHKLNNTMDQITMLVTNIRTMYGTQGNYAGLATDAVGLGIIPAVMGSSVNSLTSPFKGKVTIATIDAKSGGTGNTGFTLTYEDLPTEACIALATADFGSGAGSGFIGVQAGTIKSSGSENIVIGNANEGKALSMDATNGALADAACGAADNDVTWYFY